MAKAVMGNYGRIDLAFDHGEGSWLITADGDRFLDCASGIAVNTLGHNHPALVAALKAQAEKLWHVSNLYRIPEQEDVATRLTSLAGLDRAFFCNSGAEATEAAVKMARRAMHHRGEPERMTILCAEGAFHGRTIAMLAATDRPAFREGFGPMPDGFDHFPFGNMNALRDRLVHDTEQDTPHIAAVMVESVQGEGGAKPLPEGFLSELRALCDETGCLLIADEVQIGVGRSGHLFSFEPSGITPDIVAMAKGLAGGFPVGAVLTTETVAAAMTPGSHGSTFGGNPLAMAVAGAVLDVLGNDGFMAGMRARAARLRDGLEKLAASMPDKLSIRGGGMLLGLVLAPSYPAAGLVGMLREAHILSVPASENTVRLLPPLTISDDEIDLLLETLARVLPQLKEDTA
ncbi:MAG: aspartate aminotransferase family protein [Candidatus Puniceispirillales bacterium]